MTGNDWWLILRAGAYSGLMSDVSLSVDDGIKDCSLYIHLPPHGLMGHAMSAKTMASSSVGHTY